MLEKLIRHNQWANETWIRFVADQAPSDGFLLGRMSHILLAEQVWLQRIDGEQPRLGVWEALTVPQLLERHAVHAAVFNRLLSEDGTRVVSYTRFTGERLQSPVSDLLLHLSLHSSHHRGQMAVRASAIGLKPVNTDFIVYSWQHGV